MADIIPEYTPEVLELMARKEEMVTAADLAPIVHINPGVIVKYAKTGKWTLSEFQIIGEGPNAHVKFCRMDFLRKMGFIGEETPEKTTNEKILEELTWIRETMEALIGHLKGVNA